MTVPRLRAAADDEALATATRADAEGLRASLAAAGYHSDAVRDAVGSERVLRDPVEVLVYLYRLRSADPRLAGLIKLFALGLDVPAGEAAVALGETTAWRLVEAQVLEHGPAGVGSRVALLPVPGALLASDWELREPPQSRDHVLGLSPSTDILARLAPARPVGRVLDLCTGGGVQAILVAPHADRVVGVDVNRRALRFAAFNCWLNGVGNVDLRWGDLFEPVSGERFELILANPPYVISPENAFAFRDSGAPGDSFSESVVRQLPGHLEPGGLAYVLISWGHRANEDAAGPVRRWVEGSGCDALLLHAPSLDPVTYAEGWNRSHGHDAPVFARRFAEWLAYLEELDMERVTWGALVLRRSGGATWFHVHDVRADDIGASGQHVLRLLASKDLLARLVDDEALLGARLVPSEHHLVEQLGRIGGGSIEIGRVVLRPRNGIRLTVALDAATTYLLSALDGRRTIAQALEAVAERGDLAADSLVPGALPGVRRLIELGFLVDASAADA